MNLLYTIANIFADKCLVHRAKYEVVKEIPLFLHFNSSILYALRFIAHSSSRYFILRVI